MPGMSDANGQPQSLGEYIQANNQQVMVHDMSTGLGYLTSRVEDGPITDVSQVTSAPDASEGQGGVALGGVTSQPSTPQPNPEMDTLRARLEAAERAHEETRNLLMQQAQAAARAEQQRFLQSLEGLDEDERNSRLLQFQNQQLTAVNRALNERLTQTDQQAEQTRQQIAKTQVAHIIAQKNGLGPEYAQVLLRAATPEDMERDGAFFGSQFASRQAAEQEAQRAAFQANPALRPTGDNAGAPVVEGPKKRSGDLQGLINSRQYSLAPAR